MCLQQTDAGPRQLAERRATWPWETIMAGDPQPFASPTEEYALPDEYEFDPDDELEPGNDFVDAALTRAGELVLDLIETVQAHPVLTASLLASGVGLLGGLIAARVAPRKRPAPALPSSSALADELVAVSSERAGRAWSRFNREGGQLLQRAVDRGRASLDDAAAVSDRGRESARFALPRWRRRGEAVVEQARENLSDLPSMGHGGQAPFRKAAAVAQLGPLAVTLLRNPVVRDLLIHLAMRQVRRVGR